LKGNPVLRQIAKVLNKSEVLLSATGTMAFLPIRIYISEHAVGHLGPSLNIFMDKEVARTFFVVFETMLQNSELQILSKNISNFNKCFTGSIGSDGVVGRIRPMVKPWANSLRRSEHLLRDRRILENHYLIQSLVKSRRTMEIEAALEVFRKALDS